MGYIRHDAIIVTSWKDEHLSVARDEAERLGLSVSDIAESHMNGYASFLIAPDGSKEGWEESTKGEAARDAWKAWARVKAEHDDIWIDWAHVRFGGDDPECAELADHNGKEEQ